MDWWPGLLSLQTEETRRMVDCRTAGLCPLSINSYCRLLLHTKQPPPCCSAAHPLHYPAERRVVNIFCKVKYFYSDGEILIDQWSSEQWLHPAHRNCVLQLGSQPGFLIAQSWRQVAAGDWVRGVRVEGNIIKHSCGTAPCYHIGSNHDLLPRPPCDAAH